MRLLLRETVKPQREDKSQIHSSRSNRATAPSGRTQSRVPGADGTSRRCSDTPTNLARVPARCASQRSPVPALIAARQTEASGWLRAGRGWQMGMAPGPPPVGTDNGEQQIRRCCGKRQPDNGGPKGGAADRDNTRPAAHKHIHPPTFQAFRSRSRPEIDRQPTRRGRLASLNAVGHH